TKEFDTTQVITQLHCLNRTFEVLTAVAVKGVSPGFQHSLSMQTVCSSSSMPCIMQLFIPTMRRRSFRNQNSGRVRMKLVVEARDSWIRLSACSKHTFCVADFLNWFSVFSFFEGVA